MYKNKLFIFILSMFYIGLANSSDVGGWQKTNFQLVNPLDEVRLDAPICISSDQLPGAGETVSFQSNSKTLPYQLTDCNGDAVYSDYLLLVDFQPLETKTIEAFKHPSYSQPSEYSVRVQSDMAVRVGGTPGKDDKLIGGQYLSIDSAVLPASHFVGDRLYKYEGVGLESDQIAYRYYFDHRGSLDVFGKKTKELVLKNVGLDGTDYHALDDWGMDVLKVGNSYGLGTPAVWNNNTAQRLSEFNSLEMQRNSGVNSAAFELQFTDLKTPKGKTDVTSRYSINHGDAKVRVDVHSSKLIKLWSTGIVNHKVVSLRSHDDNSEWGYLATFGQQSLAGDNLGLAVLFRSTDFVKTTSDDSNHHVVLQPNSQQFSYYFMSNWQQGNGGVATLTEFKALLEQQVRLLNNPIQIK